VRAFDLLRGFVSNRTRRKFSAYLVRQLDGKVGFEFEARGKASAAPKAEEPAPAPYKAAARKTPVKKAAKKRSS
jgi:DNA topoisomerase-3